jgi:hypothetical protein
MEEEDVENNPSPSGGVQRGAGGQHLNLNHRRPTMEMDWGKEVMALFCGVGLVGVAVVDMVALVMGPTRGWAHIGHAEVVSGVIMGGLGCFLLLNFFVRIFSFCMQQLTTG